MELKTRLGEMRRSRGYSLRQLRELIEQRTGERMSVSYLSELERLDMTPSIEVLTRIARGYDLSVQELLGPVVFSTSESEPWYPQSLLEFVESNELDNDWLDTLSRIEYRGTRPDSPEEWNAIYAVLKALIEPKARR